MANILGPIIGLVVGALIAIVVCLVYILSSRREYEEECADLRRQIMALQQPEYLTNMCLPDMAERAKIRSEAEARLIKECEHTIIMGIRQALIDGHDSLNINLSRFPAKVVTHGLRILDNDDDYHVTTAAGDTYRITWGYGP